MISVRTSERFRSWRIFDGRTESASVEYNADFEWRSGAQASADLEVLYEDVAEDFSLPRHTVVPAGRYRFATLDAGIDSPPGALARAELDVSAGTFYDGWRASVGAESRWNASRHLELAAEYEFDAVRFPSRSQGFDSHVVRIRVAAALDTRASATALVQHASVDRRLATNLRLRYNFAEGHDFWLVYDDLWTGGAAHRRSRHTLLAKYTRTFVW